MSAWKGAFNMSGPVNDIIGEMVQQIIKLCDPCMIYLVSRKTNTAGKVTSFKLCVVVEDSILPEQVETKLLLKTDLCHAISSCTTSATGTSVRRTTAPLRTV